MGEAALVFSSDAPEAVGLEGAQRAYRSLRERVAKLRPPCFWPAQAGKPPLSPAERAGLIRLVDAIPGPCCEANMVAVMQAMRHAPAGDIVEIGSAWGRSAALLVLLARRYEIGHVLCVDPWASAIQEEPTSEIDGLAADESLRIFEINLAPLADGRLNYLRCASAEAARLYGSGMTVTTEVFGQTRYAGEIALLQIDGRHSGAEAARDCALWSPQVAAGGWIVFDGYNRPVGDGPRRAADAFVARESGRIAAHFEAGSSLFLQLRR